LDLRRKEENMMASRILGVAAALAVCSCWGADAILIGDATLNSSAPAVNAGSLPTLNIGNGNTALLQFDLSPLPPGTTVAQISKAALLVFVTNPPIPSIAGT
jgi:hypothetical protein